VVNPPSWSLFYEVVVDWIYGVVRPALARPTERLQVWLAEPASKPWPGRPTEKN